MNIKLGPFQAEVEERIMMAALMLSPILCALAVLAIAAWSGK